jgi:hypothetical protein
MLDAAPPAQPIDLDAVDWDAVSVPADEFQGMPARQVPLRVIAGRAGGTATVSFTGTFAAGSWRVVFDRYSDDGASFVSGTESLVTPSPVAAAVWSADLTISGDRNGYLRGQLYVGPQNTFSGHAESEVDGTRWAGIPTQETCPGVVQAPLVVTATGAGRGEGRRVDVRVTARIPEDPTLRPVHGARVTAGGHTARTDREGRATLVVPGKADVVVVAEAGGFRPASTVLAR